MKEFSQGDIVKVDGYRNLFVITSNNAFIRQVGMFHVNPLINDLPAGPIHAPVKGRKGSTGTLVCEQMKLIDPQVRSCSIKDHLPYSQIMEVSDIIQGLFEYD